MYAFIRSLPMRSILAAHGPALAGSWLIAELLYKFGSFTLELAAFLGTWFVIDAALSFILRLLSKGKIGDSRA